GSVTLKDGFYIPAGKTVRIYVGGISFKNCIPVFAGIPSVNQNYISIKTFKTPNVFTEADANATFSVCDVNQNIQYFDGLGRLLQIVSTQA
ncbi:hypothetical protein, partial [Salmonella enterica]|uniref:DUF6443 domain-containing protein n=1 Tax=Salmonella enterica TaxID=28901 RepID=UPI0020C4270A